MKTTNSALTRTVELSSEEVDALMYGIETALEETTCYLERGDLRVDYGKEAPEYCGTATHRYRLLAEVCNRLGEDGVARKCHEMATHFEDARREMVGDKTEEDD